jgi:hypothetical protein
MRIGNDNGKTFGPMLKLAVNGTIASDECVIDLVKSVNVRKFLLLFFKFTHYLLFKNSFIICA